MRPRQRSIGHNKLAVIATVLNDKKACVMHSCM